MRYLGNPFNICFLFNNQCYFSLNFISLVLPKNIQYLTIMLMYVRTYICKRIQLNFLLEHFQCIQLYVKGVFLAV